MSLQLHEISIEEQDLKKILSAIKTGNRSWQEEDTYLLVTSMIKHIGSVDSELRDELIYSSFYDLILEKNQLEHELLMELLEYCINDLLFKGIGENETDTVFTRSFTSLLISLILTRDNEDHFLSKQSVYKTKAKCIEYLSSEKDMRGYVPEKGWAHSVAHAADMIDALVKNPKISRASYVEILEPLWRTIFQSKTVFIHDEDERLLVPIVEMLDNGLEIQKVEKLLQNVPMELKNQKVQLDEEHYRFLMFNCKTFLKSFYIKMSGNPNFESLHQSIEKCLKELC
ncbi:DUF2785 domain-containing protein [Lysinibacillus fusiformis]|nr:DUF2785 domain-containing protein [Lysinibacillus fusiformis]